MISARVFSMNQSVVQAIHIAGSKRAFFMLVTKIQRPKIFKLKKKMITKTKN